MSKILLLGARRNQLAAIHSAQRLGLTVVTLDPDPNAIGMAIADHSVVCDLSDREHCLAVARRHAVQGALTICAEYPVPTLAFLCEQLGLPGLSVEAARLSTNKVLMRSALQAAGVPCPEFAVVPSVKDARLAVGSWGDRCVVKPAVGNGGQGITCLPAQASHDEVTTAFVRAASASRNGEVLVEQYIEGPEFSVECVSAGSSTTVVAVTDKYSSGHPYHVEIGHSQPSRLDESDLASVRKVAMAAIVALGIENSASHTEIRLGVNGPQVIEVGARLGGGFISSHLVPLSTGTELVEATIRLALGESPQLTSRVHRGAAIRFLTPLPGHVTDVLHVEQVQRIPGVVEVVVETGRGDVVRPLLDNSCRAGHVICSAATAPAAWRLATEAATAIHIRTDDVGVRSTAKEDEGAIV